MNLLKPGCLLPLVLAAGLLLPACSGNRELLRRARAGEAAAQFEYGRRLLTGQHLLYANRRYAPGWFRLAAQQGYSPAQAALGACYEAGLGVAPSPAESRYWYGLAAAQGNPIGAMHLALANYREARDPARALDQLERVANAGYLPARMQFAHLMLSRENASLQEIRRGIDQLRIAAIDGSGEAAYLMGLIYASGTGVPQHSGIALGWIETAAEAEYTPALELLNDLREEN